MDQLKKLAIVMVTVCLVAFASVSCAKAPPPPPPPPPPPEPGSLVVEPPEVELAFPAILGKPPKFSGSGWPANNTICVELELPSGVIVPAVEPGENAPLGAGFTDANGNFEITMSPVTELFTFFRTHLSGETFTPVMEKFDPLPPGLYTVVATAVESGASTIVTIELKAPPPKE